MLAIAGLLARDRATVQGSATFEGRDLLGAESRELRSIRGNRIGFVFQDPMASLNPVLTVGYQIAEAIRLHERASKAEAWRRAGELLELVGIPDPKRGLLQYPHQFSGGMRQRVMIAAALSTNPVLLIADEPTTALDVTVQAQVLDLLRRLQRELGMATILISHDLGVVAGLVDRVMVMYAGRAMELGPTDDVLQTPLHPYSDGLLRSIPRIDRPRGYRLAGIPGRLPDPTVPIEGCVFCDRCDHAFDRCARERPVLEPVGAGRYSACWLSSPAHVGAEG